MDKKHCVGCHDDFYNGKNPYGVTECWNLKDAKLGRFIIVHRDQPPPYRGTPEMVPTCHRRPDFVKVRPEQLTKDGYWR